MDASRSASFRATGIDDALRLPRRRARRHVAFPLGGIGSGSVSLTGSGRLIDWSIRNRPAIHQHNGYSHFAIKAERDGELLDARVLNGPYEGLADRFAEPTQVRRLWLRRQPRLDGRRAAFRRRRLSSGDFRSPRSSSIRDAFPGKVRMTAFSPFIPHNDRDSSMPAALFAFAVENDTDAPIDYTVAATLGNYGCDSGVHVFSQSGAQRAALHLGRRRPSGNGNAAISRSPPKATGSSTSIIICAVNGSTA